MIRNMVNSHRTRDEIRSRALFITSVYAILGAGWILGSDHLASLLAGEMAELIAFQRLKGLSYVVLTSGLLFALVSHALRALRESERGARIVAQESHELGAYVNAIIQAAPLAIFDFTPDGRIVSLWNRAAERMFGIRADEAIDSIPDIITESQWNLIAASRREVESGIAVPLLEVELLRRDGTPFPAVVAAAPVMHDDGLITVAIVSDLSEIQLALHRLEGALAEREVLLREIHHRVKNNLQIVSSLLLLERRNTGDAAEPGGLGRALARIRTIARIHEQLYHGEDLARVDLATYLNGLTGEIVSTFTASRSIRLESRFDTVLADLDTAIPLGLILHELLTDACEHAFSSDDDAQLRVELNRTDDGIELMVTDNGSRLTSERTQPGSKLGLMLVDSLTSQMKATLEKKNLNGLSVSVRAVLTTQQQTK